MKFSYNWLKELVPFKESPQELAEFLTLRAFEVESVEQHKDDWALDVKITPNRVADCSGHWGLAREIAFLKKLRIKNQESRIKEDTKRRSDDSIKIEIENPDDCARYTSRVMTDVAIKSSPQWLRDRLEICGIQSISNVVDAANYVMLELGQPLHVFDFQKIKNMEIRNPKSEIRNKSIIVRRAEKGEKILTLDDKTYELNPEILVIADEQKPIAIAGIKGGKESGVSESTITLVLEAANFDPIVIRRGARSLGLKTDASFRFEHGMAQSQTSDAIDRLAMLTQELAGGTILKGAVDAYPNKQPAQKILFRAAYANGVIGQAVNAAFYKGLFERIGCGVNSKKQGKLIVEPPPERLDLRIEEDLVEEATRALGYENIPIVMPYVSLIPPERNNEMLWEERIRTALAGAGYTEYQPYFFTGERELKQFFAEEGDMHELENPTGPETQYLIPRLAIKYAAAAANILREYEETRLFGIGKQFHRSPIKEKKELAIVLAEKSVKGKELFYELKGAADQFLEGLGISDHWYDDQIESETRKKELRMFHPFQTAQVKIGDEWIGTVGTLHPAVAENLKSRGSICLAEFDFSSLARHATAEAEFRPVGKYPAIVRDIAVVVPERTKTEEIQNVIEESAGKNLIDVDLFDYFQDEELTARNTKSLAFHLVFQSPKRTLKDEEVSTSLQKIVSALEKQGWVVKK